MFFGIQAARAVDAERQFQHPIFSYPFSFYPFTHPSPWERQIKVYTEPWMAEETRRIHPNVLPGYERAEIPRSKLVGYALDPAHEPDGKHKARVFKTALGFDQSNWTC